MIKKGIVGSVQSNGTWEGKYGMMYKYEVHIGEDVGEYSSKMENQNKFIKGQEAEYEFIGGQYPKIKPVNNFQPNSGGGYNNRTEDPDRQRMIVKQSSLKVAADLCVANNKADLNSVFIVAEKIVEWVMEKPSVTPTPAPAISVVQPANQKVRSSMSDVENFAEQSGQTSYPKQDDQLPF